MAWEALLVEVPAGAVGGVSRALFSLGAAGVQEGFRNECFIKIVAFSLLAVGGFGIGLQTWLMEHHFTFKEVIRKLKNAI